MKQSLLSLLLIFSVVLSYSQEKNFNQDIATIHDVKDGLPDEPILEVELDDSTPIASTKNESYKWDGTQWIKSKKSKIKNGILIKNYKTILKNLFYGLLNDLRYLS